MPTLGSLLKRQRDRHGWTQQEVVDRAGLDRSSSYISSIETGKTSPSIDELDAWRACSARPRSICCAKRAALPPIGNSSRTRTWRGWSRCIKPSIRSRKIRRWPTWNFSSNGSAAI